MVIIKVILVETCSLTKNSKTIIVTNISIKCCLSLNLSRFVLNKSPHRTSQVQLKFIFGARHDIHARQVTKIMHRFVMQLLGFPRRHRTDFGL